MDDCIQRTVGRFAGQCTGGSGPTNSAETIGLYVVIAAVILGLAFVAAAWLRSRAPQNP